MMIIRRKTIDLLVLALVGSLPVLADDFDLSWHTVDGGGGYSAGGGFELEGTIGQPEAGMTLSGGDFTLSGGFWPGGISSAPLPGDCDGDGDVDLDDYADMEACLFGPGGGLGTGCECFDFDGDSDNDLADFAELQVRFTGP